MLWGPQGGAAEAVAAQLEGRLRAALKARGNPFTEGGPAAYGVAASTGRPLLALFDRTFELRCLQVSGSEPKKSVPHHSVHSKARACRSIKRILRSVCSMFGGSATSSAAVTPIREPFTASSDRSTWLARCPPASLGCMCGAALGRGGKAPGALRPCHSTPQASLTSVDPSRHCVEAVIALADGPVPASSARGVKDLHVRIFTPSDLRVPSWGQWLRTVRRRVGHRPLES